MSEIENNDPTKRPNIEVLKMSTSFKVLEDCRSSLPLIFYYDGNDKEILDNNKESKNYKPMEDRKGNFYVLNTSPEAGNVL